MTRNSTNYLDTTLPFANDSRLEPEYAEAYNAWKQLPNPQTSSALLRTIDPVISSAIKSYGGQSQGSPVLRSKARYMALKSLDSYDPRKAGLKTYLLTQLRGLQRVGAQQAHVIRQPEQVLLDRRRLQRAEHELEQKLGRPPSIHALADYTGLSVKRIAYIKQGRQAFAPGQVQSLHDAQVELPATAPGGMQQAEWADLIYYDLSETDKAIYDHLTGSHSREPLSTSALAKRLGFTPSAISQRAVRIQNMIDEVRRAYEV